MIKIIEKPFLFFLGVIPVILIISFFFSKETFDVNIHDTYFIFYGNHFIQLISLILFFMGIGYWVISKVGRKFIKWITFLHIVFTSIGILSFLIYYFGSSINNKQAENNYSVLESFDMNMLFTLGFLIFIIGQFFYPINILLSLIKKKHV